MALTSMTDLIRASTTSMTSVPKPLKFMIPHYDKMKEVYAKITDESVKVTNYLKQKNAWIQCLEGAKLRMLSLIHSVRPSNEQILYCY